MPKFEVLPLAEIKLKKRIPSDLIAMVDEFKRDLEKLGDDKAGRYTLGKGEDAAGIRKAVRFAAESMNKRILFPFRGEEGSLTFYLEEVRRRGRPPKSEAEALAPAPGKRKRGRPRKLAG